LYRETQQKKTGIKNNSDLLSFLDSILKSIYIENLCLGEIYSYLMVGE